jgi:hypothetical protein
MSFMETIIRHFVGGQNDTTHTTVDNCARPVSIASWAALVLRPMWLHLSSVVDDATPCPAQRLGWVPL